MGKSSNPSRIAPFSANRNKDTFRADDTFFHESQSYSAARSGPSQDGFEATLNDRSRGGQSSVERDFQRTAKDQNQTKNDLIRIDDSQFVTLSQVVNQEDYYKARERGLREFY